MKVICLESAFSDGETCSKRLTLLLFSLNKSEGFNSEKLNLFYCVTPSILVHFFTSQSVLIMEVYKQ